MSKKKNIDLYTAKSFGEEWEKFDQSNLSYEEALERFNEYFHLFPWETLPDNAEGIDIGCGIVTYPLETEKKLKDWREKRLKNLADRITDEIIISKVVSETRDTSSAIKRMFDLCSFVAVWSVSPVPSLSLLMVFIHFSNADLMENEVSLITVIVQVSNVLSPAIFRILPLKGISMLATVEAGKFAAFTRNLEFSITSFSS